MAVMEWISVTERLPEMPAWVLVYADGAMDCMGFDKGKWQDWRQSEASGIIIDSITHWMPLPEKPEGLENGDNA